VASRAWLLMPRFAPTSRSAISVRLQSWCVVVVRGLVTGRAYQFAAGRAIQPVDARDVAGLLKKGIFRRSP
jgi:hypothetical protein